MPYLITQNYVCDQSKGMRIKENKFFKDFFKEIEFRVN